MMKVNTCFVRDIRGIAYTATRHISEIDILQYYYLICSIQYMEKRNIHARGVLLPEVETS